MKYIFIILIGLVLMSGCLSEEIPYPQVDKQDLNDYVLLNGHSGGQKINGGIANNENLTLNATRNGEGFVIINPIPKSGSVGTVGIGTDNPVDQLQLKNTCQTADSRSSFRLGTDYAWIRMFVTGNIHPSNIGMYDMDSYTRDNVTTITSFAPKPFYLGTYQAQPLKIGTNNLIRMTVNETGKIGIGTNYPRVALEINADYVPAMGQLVINNSGYKAINFYNGVSQKGFILYDESTNRMQIQNAISNGLLTLNANGGNVSIGQTANTAQFDTTGTVRFRNFGAGTMMTDALGNIYIISDEKLKTNIIPYTSGLSKILSINPINYKFTPDSGLDTQNTYTGFSAQDLRKSIPEAVYEKEDVRYEQVLKKKATIEELAEGKEDEYEQIEVKTGTTTLSISDRPIIATLVNAVKEQQKQIDQLKTVCGGIKP